MDDDEELVPLSEAKVRLHELVRELDGKRFVLLRHGRPAGVLLGYESYRHLEARRAGAEKAPIRRLLDRRAHDVARICARWNVKRLSVFGSVARDEDEPRDVDLLVEFLPMSAVEHADSFFGLQEELELLLGLPADLLEDGALDNPYLRDAAERELVVLFEAA